MDDHYKLSKEIKSGKYGKVYKAVRIADGKPCTIKRLKINKAEQIKYLEKEIETLEKCQNCIYSVQLIFHDFTDDSISFVFEQEKTTLSEMMEKPEYLLGLPHPFMIDLLSDLNNALQHFNKINFAHRNIRAENIAVFDCIQPNRRSGLMFKLTNLMTTCNAIRVGNPTGAIRGKVGDPTKGLSAEESNLWFSGLTLLFAATGFSAFGTDTHDMVKARRPKGAILYSPKNHDYINSLPQGRYERWFMFALYRLISSMFDTPSYRLLNEMTREITNAKESTFYFPYMPKIVIYADLSHSPHFSENYPTMDSVLNISKEYPAYLISENNVEYVEENIKFIPETRNFVLHSTFLSHPGFDIKQLNWKGKYEDNQENIFFIRKNGTMLHKMCLEMVESVQFARELLDNNNKMMSKNNEEKIKSKLDEITMIETKSNIILEKLNKTCDDLQSEIDKEEKEGKDLEEVEEKMKKLTLEGNLMGEMMEEYERCEQIAKKNGCDFAEVAVEIVKNYLKNSTTSPSAG